MAQMESRASKDSFHSMSSYSVTQWMQKLCCTGKIMKSRWCDKKLQIQVI